MHLLKSPGEVFQPPSLITGVLLNYVGSVSRTLELTVWVEGSPRNLFQNVRFVLIVLDDQIIEDPPKYELGLHSISHWEILLRGFD